MAGSLPWRRVARIAVVVALMAVGVVTAVVGLMSDHEAAGIATDGVTDAATARVLGAWLLLPVLFFHRSRPGLVMAVGASVALCAC